MPSKPRLFTDKCKGISKRKCVHFRPGSICTLQLARSYSGTEEAGRGPRLNTRRPCCPQARPQSGRADGWETTEEQRSPTRTAAQSTCYLGGDSQQRQKLKREGSNGRGDTSVQGSRDFTWDFSGSGPVSGTEPPYNEGPTQSRERPRNVVAFNPPKANLQLDSSRERPPTCSLLPVLSR